MMHLLAILITAIFLENFVLNQILGICPFIGVSNKMDSAIGMGLAVTFVMLLAGVSTWCVNQYLLIPLQLEYLQTIAFILIIASLVQFIEMVIKKTAPNLYQALGVFLPLITTNCAVLGVALNSVTYEYNVLESVVYGFATGIGFLIAIVLMAGIREKIEYNDIPKTFQGTATVLLTACLMSIAFMGFSGMI